MKNVFVLSLMYCALPPNTLSATVGFVGRMVPNCSVKWIIKLITDFGQGEIVYVHL